MTKLNRRGFGALLAGALAVPTAGRAAPAFPPPEGKPILAVSGRIGQFNAGDRLLLDRPALEALGQDGFDTATPWYTGPVRFDGVPMARLMRAVGATGTVVRAQALNDYTTDIPVSDFERFGVLLATRRNGEPMPVRDKGPIFIIYPFDRFPELQAHQYYSRSAWQVASLIVT